MKTQKYASNIVTVETKAPIGAREVKLEIKLEKEIINVSESFFNL